MSKRSMLESRARAYMKRFPAVRNLVIKPAKVNGKRFTAVFDLRGKKITKHFGLAGAYTWFDGAPVEKRNSYRARASKITNKRGQYTYKIAGTSNSLAYWILW